MATTDTPITAAHAIAAASLLAVKAGYLTATLAGNVTLAVDTHPMVCGFDPGGSARDVTLDGSAATDSSIHGLFRMIVNKADGAENLVLKDAAASTIATLNQNEAAIVYHDEDDGWVLVCLFTAPVS
jgi:hypothetical protein